jgi:hypothetical protein
MRGTNTLKVEIKDTSWASREGNTALTALGCSEAVKLWEGKNTLQHVRIGQANFHFLCPLFWLPFRRGYNG